MQKTRTKARAPETEQAAEDSASLRQRKHDFVRAEIEQAAWDLFGTVGFEKATIESISQKAGVSRRTFFRYFHSKEELVTLSICACGERTAEVFAQQPRTHSPLQALEQAMLEAMREQLPDTERPKELVGAMFQTPELRGRLLWAMDQWVPGLSRELVRRKAFRGDPARCELAAALYCTAFDHAHQRWHREPGTGLETQLKRAFRQLRESQ